MWNDEATAQTIYIDQVEILKPPMKWEDRTIKAPAVAEGETEDTYVDWDFTTIWDYETGINDSYPMLQWYDYSEPVDEILSLSYTALVDLDAPNPLINTGEIVGDRRRLYYHRGKRKRAFNLKPGGVI